MIVEDPHSFLKRFAVVVDKDFAESVSGRMLQAGQYRTILLSQRVVTSASE